MPKLTERAEALRASVFSELAARRATRPHKVLPLHIGDTYLLPPVRIKTPKDPDNIALYQYNDPLGELSLRQAICHDLRRRHLSLVPDEVVITAGATHGLSMVLQALLASGDEVLLLSPYWPLFPSLVRVAGGVPIEVPFFEALRRGEPLLPLLEARRTPRTKALYFASPNNPDGAVIPKEALSQLIAFAKAYDLWVIADEVYEAYVYDDEPAFPAHLLDPSRVISAYSLSKSHAMAGLRAGFMTAPVGLIEILRRLLTHTIFQVPLFVQQLAKEAIEDGAAWQENARGLYQKARDLVCNSLQAKFFHPKAGAYVFLDLTKEARGDIWRVIDAALDAGVSLAPGGAFGPSYASWARLCFTAAPLEDVIWGVERLNETLERLR